MRLPFVSRKQYEDVIKHCDFIESQLNHISKKYGELKGIEELHNNTERVNGAYKIKIDELYSEMEEFKEREEHYKRSIAAFKFQSSRRKQKLDQLKVVNKESLQTIKELDNLNSNLIEKMRKIEKENNEYQEYIKKLCAELNKPTVEELKYENCLVEHHKLAGRRRNKMGN